MTPSLYIATPASGAVNTTAYTISLVKTMALLTRAGVNARPVFAKDGSVSIARNVLVANFMASGDSHLLFIDADVSWNEQDVMRMLAVSEKYDIDACCGVYARKTLPLSLPVNCVTRDGGPARHPQIDLWELHDACTGFLMLRRSVLARMMAAYPEHRCILREDTPAAEVEFEYNLFDFWIDSNRRYLTEDHGFTRLWQGIGGKIWADPQIQLKHHGAHAYQGGLNDLLEKEK